MLKHKNLGKTKNKKQFSETIGWTLQNQKKPKNVDAFTSYLWKFMENKKPRPHGHPFCKNGCVQRCKKSATGKDLIRLRHAVEAARRGASVKTRYWTDVDLEHGVVVHLAD